MSVDIATSLKTGAGVLRSTISLIRANVIESKKSRENPRVSSLAARIVSLLEKLAEILELTSQRVGPASSGIAQLAPYTYVFQVDEKEVVVMRIKPEHTVVSVNIAEKAVSIKLRKGVFEVSPSSLKIKTRGVNVTLNPADWDHYREKLNEVKNALKIFEAFIIRRLSLLPKLKG